MRTAISAFALFWLVFLNPAFAWDGIDADTGGDVSIEPGNTVRSGNDIEVYDYSTGEYHDVTVDDINRSGGTVDVEGYDSNTGEYRTFEFDDNDN